jgi:Tc toxin complex TcA C-terminal TcB-binding domain
MTAPAGAGPVPISGGPVPPLPLAPLDFCIPPNPTVGVLRGHAELGLRKLRSGRNISGILREVPAYAAPTDTVTGMPVAVNGQISLPSVRAVPPTAYRYSVLIARVKELAQQAAQIEPQYLAAIERLDDATFTRMQARQALTLAGAQTRLESLRVNQANDGVALAQQQTQRVLIQQQTYQTWIASGLNEYEQAMLGLYEQAAVFQSAAAVAAAAVQTAQAVTTAATASETNVAAAAAGAVVVGSFAATGAAAAIGGALVNRNIQTNALMASQQRRVDEWQLQAALATQDLQIGKQQESLAQDNVAITVQQKSIADTQESQARDTVEFLANRFTGPDLWDFMIGIYGDVYRALLQQAAAVLNVAKAQLAFERQENPPIAVSADYWTAPSSAATTLAASPADDRRGLTGSARLLADLYQLDQYAFDTNKRKIGVTKTISLAQLAPAEFQKFRETGVITFATPAELFDRDFPGLYLRLIRRVRAQWPCVKPI